MKIFESVCPFTVASTSSSFPCIEDTHQSSPKSSEGIQDEVPVQPIPRNDSNLLINHQECDLYSDQQGSFQQCEMSAENFVDSQNTIACVEDTHQCSPKSSSEIQDEVPIEPIPGIELLEGNLVINNRERDLYSDQQCEMPAETPVDSENTVDSVINYLRRLQETTFRKKISKKFREVCLSPASRTHFGDNDVETRTQPCTELETSKNMRQSCNQDPIPCSSHQPELPVDTRANLRNSSALTNTDENNDEFCSELPCEFSHQSSNQDPIPCSSHQPELPVDVRVDLRNSSALTNTDENNDESFCHQSNKDRRDPFSNDLLSNKVNKEATSRSSAFEYANLFEEREPLSPASSVVTVATDIVYQEHLSTLKTCFMTSSHSLKAAEKIHKTENHSVSDNMERQISLISPNPSTGVNHSHLREGAYETPEIFELLVPSLSAKSILGENPISLSATHPLDDVPGCSNETQLPHNFCGDEIYSKTETACEFTDNPLSVKNVVDHHAHLVSEQIKTKNERKSSSSNTNHIPPDEIPRCCSKTCKSSGRGGSYVRRRLRNLSYRLKEAKRVYQTECCNVMQEFQEFLSREVLPSTNKNQYYKSFDDILMPRHKNAWFMLKLMGGLFHDLDRTENVSESIRKCSENHNDEWTGETNISDLMQLDPDYAERGYTCCYECLQHRKNSKRTCVKFIEETQDRKKRKID